MKVADFSRQLGIPDSKVRYYDRMGLVKGQRKESNNYRDFTNSDAVNIYHAQMLRSFGMGIQESLEMKEKELPEIDDWITHYSEKLEEQIRFETMRLNRLQEMKRYFQMIQDETDLILECRREASYNMMNFGKVETLSSEKQRAIRKLVDVMPFSYVAIRIPRESLLGGQEELDVNIGLGILEKNKELLHIEFPKEVTIDPDCRVLRFLFEVPDPFQLKKSDLKPLFVELEKRNYEICEDLLGRIFISHMKNGVFVHVVGVGVEIKEKS